MALHVSVRQLAPRPALRSRGVVLHHADVPRNDRAWVGSLPVTATLRTLTCACRKHISPSRAPSMKPVLAGNSVPVTGSSWWPGLARQATARSYRWWSPPTSGSSTTSLNSGP